MKFWVFIFVIGIGFCLGFVVGVMTPTMRQNTPSSLSAPAVSAASKYVGKWVTADNSRVLIINADGTAFVPSGGAERQFKWHIQDDRIIFDGWEVIGYSVYGFEYGVLEEGDRIRLCNNNSTEVSHQTWFRSKN